MKLLFVSVLFLLFVVAAVVAQAQQDQEQQPSEELQANVYIDGGGSVHFVSCCDGQPTMAKNASGNTTVFVNGLDPVHELARFSQQFDEQQEQHGQLQQDEEALRGALVFLSTTLNALASEAATGTTNPP